MPFIYFVSEDVFFSALPSCSHKLPMRLNLFPSYNDWSPSSYFFHTLTVSSISTEYSVISITFALRVWTKVGSTLPSTSKLNFFTTYNNCYPLLLSAILPFTILLKSQHLTIAILPCLQQLDRFSTFCDICDSDAIKKKPNRCKSFPHIRCADIRQGYR